MKKGGLCFGVVCFDRFASSVVCLTQDWMEESKVKIKKTKNKGRDREEILVQQQQPLPTEHPGSLFSLLCSRLH